MQNVTVMEFFVQELRCALPLDRVIEVTLRVDVTRLPEAPPYVVGVMRYRGRTVPVIDFGRRLGLDDASPRLDDHFIIVDAERWPVALVVHRAERVCSLDVESPPFTKGLIAGLSHLDDGLVFIQDIDALLSKDEEIHLDELLEAHRGVAVESGPS